MQKIGILAESESEMNVWRSCARASLLVCVFAFGLDAAEFAAEPRVMANPNPSVPLAAVIQFEADAPAETTLSVSDGERNWELQYPESRDPTRGLPVLGMRPGRRHEIRVSIRDANGERLTAPKTLEFVTPSLPADPAEFPPINVRVSKPDRMEPGVTVLSVRRSLARRPPGAGARQPATLADVDRSTFGVSYGLLLGLDTAGEVVWYYRTDIRISDFEFCRNGNIVYLTADHRAIEIDLLGNKVREWYASKGPHGPSDGMPVPTMTFHHAVEELPSGNLLVLGGEVREIENYYTSEKDPDAPRKTQKVMGDEVLEFTRAGKVVGRWNAFDHLPVFRLGYLTFNNYWGARGFPDTWDWTHGNGLFYNPNDDSMLLNLRQQSAVVKIKRSSGEIHWILAPDEDWPEELRAKLIRPAGEMDWPWHQHAPTITPRRTLLLFNNGINQARPFEAPVPFSETYSRATEYAFDSKKKTVHTVWASDNEETAKVRTFAMGDTSMLPTTGNVFVCYGGSTQRQQPGARGRGRPWPLVREVTSTTPPAVLFEVVLAQESGRGLVNWQLFGGERLPDLY
ncbi:MAG: aryl-sulfate sulfotransferase [bacterium]|nr:aryl-sulfate sulfotransferase [bacterium]